MPERTPVAAPGRPPRVILLSSGSAITVSLLKVLSNRGLQVTELIIYPPGHRGPMTLRGHIRTLISTVRWSLGVLYRSGLYRSAGPLGITGPLNSRRMIAKLRRSRPDVLILAHTRLVSDEVLAIPSRGVFNVHAGLLPWIRGNSPLHHSLLRQVPLGSTIFRVDPGIDTGAIVARRLVDVTGAETGHELHDRAVQLWIDLTADLVDMALHDRIPEAVVQHRKYPLCSNVTCPDQMAQVVQAIENRTAQHLFERWETYCAPGTLDLPHSLPQSDPTTLP